MKIKVLHFVPGFDHGGIESRLIDWFEEIDKKQYQFDLVVAKSVKNNVLIDRFKQLGGKVYIIPRFKIKNIFIFISALNNIFKNNKYDVVHSHNPVSGAIFLKQAKKHGVKKRIMHSRTNKFSDGNSYLKIRNYLKKMSAKNSNVKLACSNNAGQWLFDDRKFTLIENGIYTDKFKYSKYERHKIRNVLDITDDEIVLGSVSRLTPIKNHKFMIDILLYLNRNRETTYKLLIVGEGPLREELEQYSMNNDITDKVIFTGKKEDTNKYYQAMDIFLFPSEHEGFGTVTIEAQSTGLKTITSTGVPQGVSITDLVIQVPITSGVKIWSEIIEDNIEYARRDRSREVLEKGFDVKNAVEKLVKVYNSK